MSGHVLCDDGCRLYVEATGRPDHAPLVLLNSLGTDTCLWDRQWPAFAARFRVCRYDTRGHGRSDVPPGGYTMDRLGADVLSVMDAAGITRANLCGISIGGLTALWLGITAPDRVASLVLANTAARIGSDAVWVERMDLVRTNGLEALADAAMARWFTPSFRQREPAQVARIRETLVTTAADGYLGCCAALRDTDLRSNACAVMSPTLVISGTHDVATTPADGRWLAGQIPGARHVQRDAAHLSNIECASQFNQAVMDFLGAGKHG